MSGTAPSVPPVTVHPRRDGDPEVELTGYYLVHRAMLRDVREIADLADRVAGGSVVLTAPRARALGAYVHQLCAEIHNHHHAEDHIVWPVIAASAGDAVDLSGLTDDHSVMDPMLARARAGADGLAADPVDRTAAAALAGAMTAMHELLDEHIGEEERDLFPIITRFVSAPDYEAVEDRIRRTIGVRHLGWVVPWIAFHATPEEAERLLRKAGFPFRFLLALTRPGFTRQRRLTFG